MQLVNFRLMESILKNIRAIREVKGFSQDQIADKLQISQSQYARFERGATKTDLETLFDFSRIVDIDLIDIITYPKKYIDVDELSKNDSSDRMEVSLKFRVDATQREEILKILNVK